MFGLFVSLAALGFFAVDLIGIAAMPILLLQKRPYARSFIFLGGSFVSLMTMGVLFAKGLGTVILHFENTHTWFVPSAEASAGLVLLGIAGTVFWRVRSGKASVEPSKSLVKRLQLGGWQLFMVGALLVLVQSALDVVFVIAMIRVGQLHLSIVTLIAAVATYTIAALAMQLAVVVAYWLSPERGRTKTLDKVHTLLTKYANQAVIGASLVLGFGLLIIAA